MNEATIVEAFKAAPFLAFAMWMVWQMKAAIDKMMDRNEASAKIIATALEKSTEMLGRNIQSAAASEAHVARLLDIVQDYTEEKRRAHGGGS